MPELDNYIDRFNVVVGHLAEVARLIPEGKEMFKPSEDSLPWLYLVSHTATHRTICMKFLEGDKDHGFPSIYMAPENQPSNGSEAARKIVDTWEDMKTYLKNKPDDFVQKVVDPPWGPPERIMDILWWLFEEGVHHRGQALVYCRMNGVKPPVIWGT